jgi:coenzyme PQQ precursor peptide PqqA
MRLGSGCFGEVNSAAFSDGLSFDLVPRVEDTLVASEVDIGRRRSALPGSSAPSRPVAVGAVAERAGRGAGALLPSSRSRTTTCSPTVRSIPLSLQQPRRCCSAGSGSGSCRPGWSAAQVAFRPRPDVPCCIHENARKRPMTWTTPTLVEICIGLEINGYLPAEF